MVGPNGLPSICTGLPRFTLKRTNYCVFGLTVTGAVEELNKASAKLVGDGWDAKVETLSPTQHVMIVNADGKTLAALSADERRIKSGEFGLLETAATLFTVPHKSR